MENSILTLLKTKKFLTTTQAAKILSIAPDTVLKWIKSGKIKSNKTLGGHNRIPTAEIIKILESLSDIPIQKDSYQYCWEYRAKGGTVIDECKNCVNYLFRAKRCYEVKSIGQQLDVDLIKCGHSCNICDYYQRLIHREIINILILSDKKILKDEINLANYNNLNCKIVKNEYECAYTLEHFKPDYIIIDETIGKKRLEMLFENLRNDNRIPIIRILVAGKKNNSELFHKNGKKFGWIKKPFNCEQLNKLTLLE